MNEQLQRLAHLLRPVASHPQGRPPAQPSLPPSGPSLLMRPPVDDTPLPTERPLEWGPEPWSQRAVAGGVDTLLGAIGARDPLSPEATPATGLGALLGMLGPAAVMGGLKQVGRGLYSRLDDAARLIPGRGVHPNQALSLLKNNASGEELAWRGVPEWLAQQGDRVTPEALQEYLRSRPAPMPETKVLRVQHNEPYTTAAQWQQAIDRAERAGNFDEADRLDRAWEEVEGFGGPNSPKYGEYQVPGGRNYQETLSVMPTPQPIVVDLGEGAGSRWGVKLPDGTISSRYYNKGDAERAIAFDGRTAGTTYTSQHFDTPNILVHSRSNQRTLPTGERGTLIENVQSDWHQAGRKEGYKIDMPPAVKAEWSQLNARMNELEKEAGAYGIGDPGWEAAVEQMNGVGAQMAKLEKPYRGGTIPDAPFKDSWPALGLKQEILDAVERGDEWIGITPASILNQRGEQISEAFQDQRLPLTLEKILRPFGGGRAEVGPVNAGLTMQRTAPSTINAPIIRLTPEMREQIKQKGLPLLLAMLSTQLTPAPSHDRD